MIFSALGFGLAILFTALAPALWLSYLGLLFVGWASVSFISIGNSTIQLSAAPKMRGRALSLWQLGFQGTTPIGGPVIGLVIEESDARIGMAWVRSRLSWPRPEGRSSPTTGSSRLRSEALFADRDGDCRCSADDVVEG
jgi:MFS family permease